MNLEDISLMHAAGISAGLVLGLFASLLGALKLRLCAVNGLDDRQWGTVSGLLYASLFVGVLVLGFVLDRVGHRWVLAAGFTGCAVGVLVVSLARGWWPLLVGVAVLGLSASGLNNAGNTLFTYFIPGDEAAGSTLGNVFFGIGAVATPLVLAGLFLFGWRLPAIGGFFALVALAPITIAWWASYDAVASAETSPTLAGTLRMAGRLDVWLVALGFLCYGVAEVGYGTWATTHFKRSGWGESAATFQLGMFWAAFLASRLGVSQVGQLGINLTEHAGFALAGLGALAVAALGLMLIVRTKLVTPLGTVLYGGSMASGFPLLAGHIIAATPPAQQGAAFGMANALGLLCLAPVLKGIGTVVEARSIHAGLGIVAASCAGMALVGLAIAALG